MFRHLQPYFNQPIDELLKNPVFIQLFQPSSASAH